MAATIEKQTNGSSALRWNNTLRRLRALERLYEQGYQDEVVDLTVRKLVEQQIQTNEAQLHRLRAELTRFEEQYGMSSEEFYRQYQSGQAGDNPDVFEWNVFYKMYIRLQNQLAILQADLVGQP